MRSPTPRLGAALGAAVLLFAGTVPGQFGYYRGARRMTQQADQSQWGPPPQWATPMAPQSPITTVPPPYQAGFQGLMSTAPMYSAFPSYPKGYGPPPRTGGFLPEEPGDASAAEWNPAPLPPNESGVWPSWIETRVPDLESRTSAERAALARTADRVWFLAPDDTAFVPIPFYDKFRVVDSGTFVEVRNKGEFQIAFHDGAWVRSIGAVRLGLPKLSSAVAELQLTDFHRVWINARARTMVVLLPDGSKVELAGTDLYLEKQGALGIVSNHGPRAIRWTGRIGEREVPPSHRIEIFLEGSTRPYRPAGMELQGAVRAEPAGRDLDVHGEPGGGAVSWSGARFELAAGAVIHLDPLAGKSFPETKK